MLTLRVDEKNLFNKLNKQANIKKEEEYYFNYKNYFVFIEFLSNGIVSVSASNETDNFTMKYIYFTKTEIKKLIKEKITERLKNKI
jgi:hypothetical protein